MAEGWEGFWCMFRERSSESRPERGIRRREGKGMEGDLEGNMGVLGGCRFLSEREF